MPVTENLDNVDKFQIKILPKLHKKKLWKKSHWLTWFLAFDSYSRNSIGFYNALFKVLCTHDPLVTCCVPRVNLHIGRRSLGLGELTKRALSIPLHNQVSFVKLVRPLQTKSEELNFVGCNLRSSPMKSETGPSKESRERWRKEVATPGC